MIPRWLGVWGVLAALAVGIAYALLSEAGLAWTWERVRPLLPGEVEVGALKGRLAGPIRIRELDWKGPGFRLRIARAQLDWRPWHLLLATVTVNRLRASGIRYAGVPAPPTPGAGGPPEPSAFRPWVFLHLRDVRLRDLEVRAGPEAAPVRAARVDGGLGYGRRGAYLRELTLAGNGWRLTSTGRAGPAGPGRVELNVSWRWQRPAGPFLAGEGSLTGDRSTLRLRHRLEAPVPITVTGRVKGPLEKLRWQAEITGRDLDLSALETALPPGTATVAADLAGDRTSAEGRLKLDLRPAAGPAAHLATGLTISLPHQQVALRDTEVTVKGIPGAVSGEGRLNWGPSPAFELRGGWENLRWPFSGEAWLASPAGSWEISGKPAGYRYHLATTLVPPDGPGVALKARGSGTPDGLELTALHAEAPEGTLRGSGRMGWAPALSGRLRLQGTGLNPGLWLPEWPGRLSLAAEARAGPEDGLPRIRVTRLQVSGDLRGRKVSLRGKGEAAAGDAELKELKLGVGGTSLSAQGGFSRDRLDMRWRVDSEDLGDLVPGTRGLLQGKGRLQGPRAFPRIEADLEGENLAYEGRVLRHLEASVLLDPAGETASEVTATARDLRIPGLSASELHLDGRGRPADHSLVLAADTSAGRLRLAAEGIWQAEARHWRFRLTDGEVAPVRFPAWSLKAPVSGSASPQGVSLEPACWSSARGGLCLGGEWEPAGTVRLSYRAREVPLGYFLPLLPAGSALEGTLSGDGELARGGDGRLEGRATLATSAGRLARLDGPDGEAETLAEFRPSKVALAADGRTLDLEAELALGGSDAVSARLRLEQGPEPLSRWPLSGSIGMTLSDLGFLPALVPQVDAVRGMAEGDLRLAGSPARPRLRGSLEATLEQVDLPDAGLTLKGARLSARPTEHGDLRLSGSAHSDGGELRLEGLARFTGPAPALQGTLRGKDFLAFNTRDARVWVSPDLGAVVGDQRIDVTGEVRIPRAEITPQALAAKGAVTVSPDQRIVRAEETVDKDTVPRLHARIRVILGERVRVDAFGLIGRIEGDLTLVEEPGRPTTASGELRTAEGRYRAYGQNMEIETGRLLFGGGPATDPGLDVRAVRRPRRDVLVGVHARGPLREPELQLFSEPAMRQAEQLSWLVLGRPLEETSGGESEALSRAALFLGMKGGQLFAEELGAGLGLDEVRMETETTAEGEQAALVLGKYLSPRLYVSYGIGLFQPINTLRLQYTLTQHWRVVTESNAEQTGGDLLYTIERGK